MRIPKVSTLFGVGVVRSLAPCHLLPSSFLIPYCGSHDLACTHSNSFNLASYVGVLSENLGFRSERVCAALMST